MCNCNQNRMTTSGGSKALHQRTVNVKLIKDQPISIHGSYTGRLYRFNSIYDTVLVDSRDAHTLDSSFFRAES